MIDAIVFDLDGTLIDSLEDIAESMNVVLRKNGYKALDVETYKCFVGYGSYNLVKNSLNYLGGDLSHFNIKALQKQYLAIYANGGYTRSQPYPFINTLLDWLCDNNVPFGVVTNKTTELAVKIINKFFPSYSFAQIYGFDATTPLKPNPTAVLRFAQYLNIDISRIALVGDTCVDIETTNNAGMVGIGVSWGFHHKDDLIECGAVAVVDEPLQIIDIIRSI